MRLQAGSVLVQRFFAIAEEVDLAAAERLLARPARRQRLAHGAPRVPLPGAPLHIDLEARALGDPAWVAAQAWARLYDVGGLAITFRLDLPADGEGEGWVAQAAKIADAEVQITRAAAPVAEEIRAAIAPACRASGAGGLVEDYTVFTLQRCDGADSAEQVAAGLDIPRLLLGEAGPIAAAERQERMRAALSYRPDDLTVIDWNSAFVYDPAGGHDIVDLLEAACIQVLELRAYDQRVGQALDSLYQELDARQASFFRSSRFTRLSRRIMKLYVDVLEISERIDNALTLLADTFLARVHRAATGAFGIPHWQKQLRGKLEVLRQINQLLVDQVTSHKTLGIETAIVSLILLEVVMKVLELR